MSDENQASYRLQLTASSFEYFDSLSEARARADHLLRSDYSQIAIECSANGQWKSVEVRHANVP